jgi:hypothetical protein
LSSTHSVVKHTLLFTKTVTSCAKTPFHDVAFCEEFSRYAL